MSAPLAVNVAEEPTQMLIGEETTNVGNGSTFTVTLIVAVQKVKMEVPLTMYSVVSAGLAVTLEPMVAINPVLGNQV